MRKGVASRAFGRENTPSVRATRLARPTRAMLRAKCAECLCLKDNGCRGFDCEVSDCALYPAMPWRGRPMPERLRCP